MRVFLLFTLLLGLGCHTPRDTDWPRFEYVEPEMGIDFYLKFHAPNRTEAERIANLAYDRVEELNLIFSDYHPPSELNRLCRQPAGTEVRVSAELFDVLQRAQTLARETNGAFDITTGPVNRLWRVARRQQRLPDPDALKAAIKRVGHRHIKLNPERRTITLAVDNMQLDLGGIAKGYAVDEAMKVLRAEGIHRAYVAADSDVLTSRPPIGKSGWEIRVASVDRFGNVYPRTIYLKHQALSTSGDMQQFVEIADRRYSHIVDPRTGLGLTSRLQVTVVAGSSTTADSRATAICVLGKNAGFDFAKRKRLQANLLELADGKPKATTSPAWQIWK